MYFKSLKMVNFRKFRTTENIIEFAVYKWYIEGVLIISNYFFYGSSPMYPKSITKNFRIDKSIAPTLSVTDEKFMLIWRKE